MLAVDVNALIEAMERLIETSEEALEQAPDASPVSRAALDDLDRLATTLATASPGLTDPPISLDRTGARGLRNAMVDLAGYQRGELTPGLRDLRRLVDFAYPR